MIALLLGTIYGIGFGFSIVGGLIYQMVLGGLGSRTNFAKFILSIVFWPVTWTKIIYGLYKTYRDGY